MNTIEEASTKVCPYTYNKDTREFSLCLADRCAKWQNSIDVNTLCSNIFYVSAEDDEITLRRECPKIKLFKQDAPHIIGASTMCLRFFKIDAFHYCKDCKYRYGYCS